MSSLELNAHRPNLVIHLNVDGTRLRYRIRKTKRTSVDTALDNRNSDIAYWITIFLCSTLQNFSGLQRLIYLHESNKIFDFDRHVHF